MYKTLFAIVYLCFLSVTNAQTIQGKITDETGQGMPNASIYVQETASGTATNVDGFYSTRLNPGTYHLTFQYIGYATQIKQVEVKKGTLTMDVKMQPQSVTLGTINLDADAEDPAYTIMRKAIAKAEYHQLQYNKYTAEVYLKGTGKMDKVPGLFAKRLEKEGVDTSRVYTSESVSEILYERPNVYKEKVISVRTSGEDEISANPNAYVNSSFYTPEVVSSISPLAPQAFAYYKFKYLGSFLENGSEINKIKVIPRVKGEKVFSGVIYIRERFYNIHSLDLKTQLQGFDLRILQNYAPVKSEIWLPITLKLHFSGSLLGFGFSYKYLASISKYNVTVNQDLDDLVNLVDEKIEVVSENAVDVKKGETATAMDEVFKQDKEISRKDFNKLIDNYEKEQLKKEKEKRKNGEPVIEMDYWYTIDSLAGKKDSVYWNNRRPVPLSLKEVESYQIDDSVYVEDKEQRQRDSARLANGDPIQFSDLFFGSYYKVGKRARFSFDGFLPQLRFNSVEGWNMDFTGSLYWRHDTTLRLNFRPNIRYGFDSKQWYGKLSSGFGFGKGATRANVQLEGGRYIYQFNPNAIDPLINTLYTLVLVRNYMKLYDKSYAKITLNKGLSHKVSFSASAQWAERNELINNSRWSLVDRKNYGYTANAPNNIEVNTSGFTGHRAFLTSLTLNVQPWLKFYKYNGKLKVSNQNSTSFRLTYNAGWDGVANSITDFQQLEMGLKTGFDIGIKATTDFTITGGAFLNANQMDFVDFKHFDGGLTEFAPLSTTGNFRVLDYYNYSTSSAYFSTLSHIRFRKLLLTQIPVLRLAGLQENLILNYLKTENSPHYYEIGYGIDNIFRIARIELVQSFMNDKVGNFGIRIGISTNLGGN